jgi:hypothetical protein
VAGERLEVAPLEAAALGGAALDNGVVGRAHAGAVAAAACEGVLGVASSVGGRGQGG